MKLIFLILTTTLIALSATECKKPKFDPNSDNGLPPATQEGKDIFACKVNGQPWISRKGRPRMNGGISGDTTFSAYGSIKLPNGDVEYISIVLSGVYKRNKSEYQLNDTSNAYFVYERNGTTPCFSTSSAGFGNFVLKKVTGGMLTITRADTIAKIIAGTFSFIVPTDFCDTLKITEGRFDIKTRE